MVENRRNERGRRHWRRALNGLTVCATLALPIALASCSELLDVELPGAVTEDNLGPSTADVLALSVQGNVEYAWSSYVRFASHQSDEWNQQSKNADRNRAGLRQFDPSFNYYINGTYAPLHIALQE